MNEFVCQLDCIIDSTGSANWVNGSNLIRLLRIHISQWEGNGCQSNLLCFWKCIYPCGMALTRFSCIVDSNDLRILTVLIHPVWYFGNEHMKKKKKKYSPFINLNIMMLSFYLFVGSPESAVIQITFVHLYSLIHHIKIANWMVPFLMRYTCNLDFYFSYENSLPLISLHFNWIGVMVAWTGIEHFRVGRYDPPPPAEEPEDCMVCFLNIDNLKHFLSAYYAFLLWISIESLFSEKHKVWSMLFCTINGQLSLLYPFVGNTYQLSWKQSYDVFPIIFFNGFLFLIHL